MPESHRRIMSVAIEALALRTALTFEMKNAEAVAELREALMRTFKSSGTINWVTFGATALEGAYTIAGGPAYVANLIVGYDLPTPGV